jgi:hypothetical protein
MQLSSRSSKRRKGMSPRPRRFGEVPVSSTAPVEVLITGVSPFEDLPGYHYAALLRNCSRYRLRLADDSHPALTVLRSGGACIEELTHPGRDEERFLSEADELVRAECFAAVIPGADAHLFALARGAAHLPWVEQLCPTAAWIAREGLHTKWDLQSWIAAFMPIPQRWRIDGTSTPDWFGTPEAPPVLVKGLRKGAVRCEHADELNAGARALMRNPANQDAGGGIYLEEHIDGEEHSGLIVRLLDATVWIGIRKLATTQSGTTLAAIVEYDQLEPELVQAIAERLHPGMAIEIEWRGSGGGRRAFEVNVRFPSWIGALGVAGQALFSASLEAQLSCESALRPLPEAGTLIYRLPQSGVLTPDAALDMRGGGARPLLWPSASPHQFLVK